jgi:hypothetical protein
VDRVPLLAEREELRGEHGRRDRRADPLVRPEFAGRGRADHDRQEVEHRLVHRVEQHVAGRLLIERGAGILPAEGVSDDDEGDDQRGAEQCPEDRAKGVREELERVVDPPVLPPDTPVLLLRGGGPLLPHPRLLDDRVVELGDTTAHDDLESVAALRDDTEHGRHRLEGLLICSVAVGEPESQSGRAVGEVDDVVRTADLLEDAP